MSAAAGTDEAMHPVGADRAWSESYYFNFVDPTSGVGMFTRMGFRPGSGWADALHAVYLGGSRVAFTYGRRDIGTDLGAYDGDLKVGNLALTCDTPFEQWTVAYDGPAQDIPDGAILMTRARARPEGWYTPAQLSMQVDVRALTPPHYAARGEHGHFEQSVRAAGRLSLGGESFAFEGYGVRDKSWGPRNWSGASQGAPASGATAPRGSTPAAPNPFVFWFSMNFGPDAALGGSCFRRADGRMAGAGWIQDGDGMDTFEDVQVETTFRPGTILHEAVVMTGRTGRGRVVRIEGQVLNMCPTKIPFPGGATFVNEGLARFVMDGREGFGIAESWHNVTE